MLSQPHTDILCYDVSRRQTMLLISNTCDFVNRKNREVCITSQPCRCLRVLFSLIPAYNFQQLLDLSKKGVV